MIKDFDLSGTIIQILSLIFFGIIMGWIVIKIIMTIF